MHIILFCYSLESLCCFAIKLSYADADDDDDDVDDDDDDDYTELGH